METRANYGLIGGIVLGLIIAVFGFLIWLTNLEFNEDYVHYDILFERSVAGLSEGAPVRYKGIAVGQVTRLRIDEKDPARIRTTIKVQRDTPIFEDSTASLDSQGFTGLAYILLDSADGSTKPLQRLPNEPRPIIPVRPSQLQELFSSVPQLMAEASVTLSQFHKLLSNENRALVRSILQNTDRLTADLADKGPALQESIDNFNTMSVEVKAAANDYRELASTLNTAVSNDLQPTLTQMKETTKSLENMANELEAMVKDSRDPITNFTTQTLPEASEFIGEARRLAATMSRIAERIERDPSEFISQGQPEYKIK